MFRFDVETIFGQRMPIGGGGGGGGDSLTFGTGVIMPANLLRSPNNDTNFFKDSN